MKITLLAPPWITLPPNGYGGIESVVYNLAQGLTKKGHDITVFGTGDSKILGHLSSFYHQALGIDRLLHKSAVYYFLNHISFALAHMPKDTQIIHNHCEYAAMHLLDYQTIPFVHTLHGAFYKNFDSDRQKQDQSTTAFIETLHLFKDHPFVSISNAQRTHLTDLNYAATVYNSIAIEEYKYLETTDEYMAWFGRFSPLKGLDKALSVAKKTTKKLIFSASLHSEETKKQFDEEIMPLVDQNRIISLPEFSQMQQKTDFVAHAKLFLFPIQWEEPFGLVLTEAMATGTPAIAFARGSVPEIVKDGETGFIVNASDADIRGDWIVKKTGIEGMSEAVERIYNMPAEEYKQMRRNCRKHVEDHFTVERMVDEYEKVYRQIIEK